MLKMIQENKYFINKQKTEIKHEGETVDDLMKPKERYEVEF